MDSKYDKTSSSLGPWSSCKIASNSLMISMSIRSVAINPSMCDLCTTSNSWAMSTCSMQGDKLASPLFPEYFAPAPPTLDWRKRFCSIMDDLRSLHVAFDGRALIGSSAALSNAMACTGLSSFHPSFSAFIAARGVSCISPCRGGLEKDLRTSSDGVDGFKGETAPESLAPIVLRLLAIIRAVLPMRLFLPPPAIFSRAA